jgi:hypothetical protein
VLCEGVHIKEVFAVGMGDTASVKSDVAYIAMREDHNTFHLYTCMQNAKVFNEILDAKLARATKVDAPLTKAKLRNYLTTIVPDIVELLNVTLVTDLQKDHLLTSKNDKYYYVYFGAMSKTLIHVACWLRIPRGKDKQIDESVKPKLFFWMLHQSYAQELQTLGDMSNEIDAEALKKKLDLSQGIEY